MQSILSRSQISLVFRLALSSLLLAASSLVSSAQATTCLTGNGNRALTNDNLKPYASPFTFIDTGGHPDIVFDSQSTGTLTIDQGYSNTPVSTSIGIGLGLGDVTAATSPTGGIIFSYLNTSGIFDLVKSTTGYSSFGTPYSFSVPGGPALAAYYTPYLLNYNSLLYAASVATNGYIYIARSTNGTTWTNLGQISYDTTSSRPALGIFNGSLYLAYTNPSHQLIFGSLIVNGAYSPNVKNYYATFGNSNAAGAYAGLALGVYGGTFYVFGQSSGSGDNLYEVSTTNGSTFSSPSNCGAQLRWTPSVVAYGNSLDAAWYDDHNTNIYVSSLN